MWSCAQVATGSSPWAHTQKLAWIYSSCLACSVVFSVPWSKVTAFPITLHIHIFTDKDSKIFLLMDIRNKFYLSDWSHLKICRKQWPGTSGPLVKEHPQLKVDLVNANQNLYPRLDVKQTEILFFCFCLSASSKQTWSKVQPFHFGKDSFAKLFHSNRDDASYQYIFYIKVPWHIFWGWKVKFCDCPFVLGNWIKCHDLHGIRN